MKTQLFAPTAIAALFLAFGQVAPELGTEMSRSIAQKEETQGTATPAALPAIAYGDWGDGFRTSTTPTIFDVSGALPSRDLLITASYSDSHNEQLPRHSLLPVGLNDEIITVGRGDTLAVLLERADIPSAQVAEAIQALRKAKYNPRDLKAGEKIRVQLNNQGKHRDLIGLEIKPSLLKRVVLARNESNQFSAELMQRELEKKTFAAHGEIVSSLYQAGDAAGVPLTIMNDLIKAYSWDVDFQRDLRRGDHFELLYDAKVDEIGVIVRSGRIYYAALVVGGKKQAVYRYDDGERTTDFYAPDGMSIRKALLRTPVDGARISSRYGMRRHPILGYSKMHKGIDFAAPTGTPIYAAGEGVIDYIGRRGAYGKYIRLRHNGKISTAYAHLHRFGKGLKKGMRVKQRQLIGYIGSTGRSTGPHLHYEVLVNGKQVNPQSVDLPTGDPLSGTELAAFHKEVDRIRSLYKGLSSQELLVAATKKGEQGGS